MSKNRYRGEVIYQLSFKQAQHLQESGLLSEQELEEFKTYLMEKYRPIISQLSG